MFPTKRVLPLVLAVLFGGCAAGGGEGEEAASEAPAETDSHPVVILETSLGRIVMQLDREKAPKTVANFLTHVNFGFYNGLMFHRIMPDFMIQTGLLTANLERRASPAAFLDNEGDNGLKNVLGAVGMARGKDPHSAKTEIFINGIGAELADVRLGDRVTVVVYHQPDDPTRWIVTQVQIERPEQFVRDRPGPADSTAAD